MAECIVISADFGLEADVYLFLLFFISIIIFQMYILTLAGDVWSPDVS
jgi:hypothetical protein